MGKGTNIGGLGVDVIADSKILRARACCSSDAGSKDSMEPAPRRKPDYNKFVPLIYAPLLPLIRIAMRGRFPQHIIDRAFGAGVGIALAHAGVVMFSDSSV